MVSEKSKANLEKQQYEFIGSHSAVKICDWTKKSIRGEGTCYKEKFYGIRAHLCCQMSVSVDFCQHACQFCWRELGETKIVMDGVVDDPKSVFEKSGPAQAHQLVGFYGNEKADKKKLDEAKDPMHYAISLTGDALIYPKLNEFIKKLHENGKTTFVVTNGMLPEKIESMEMPTQLYISVDAPNKEVYKEIDRPLYIDGWERLQKTLEVLKTLKSKTRTTLRLTIIKGMNDFDVDGWAEQILKSDPTFIEVKAYMFIGSSRQRLTIENMPRHLEIVEFAKKLCEKTGYKIIDEQVSSRVVLLMKEDLPDRIMKFD
ncbi:4-demethylwyosine synthase TYW1 [Candidatus Woesearchaeota archaeon]|nr:MAG: 4-demethylwyosine synthase TYW1 [Candidatus Woesearchaeota archaeon]